MKTQVAPETKQNGKEDFYLFLDFDGVLYDLEYLADNKLSLKDLFAEDRKLFSFATDSIETLNQLFAELSSRYNPHLVISSFWRFLPTNLLVKSLEISGLDTTGIDIHKTKLTLHPHKRGLEIKDFLEAHGNSQNFIIADDSYLENYLEHFPAEKIVKTNILNDRLVARKLDKALAHYGLEPLAEMTDDGPKFPKRQVDPHHIKKLVASPSFDEMQF